MKEIESRAYYNGNVFKRDGTPMTTSDVIKLGLHGGLAYGQRVSPLDTVRQFLGGAE